MGGWLYRMARGRCGAAAVRGPLSTSHTGRFGFLRSSPSRCPRPASKLGKTIRHSRILVTTIIGSPAAAFCSAPLDEVLGSGEPDFPFCICWANEPWSRRWDGSDTDLLIAQEHDLETDKRLILDLLPLFRDRRYIKVDGKPLLVIYRVGLLPDPRALSRFWREVARENGFPDLHICMAETFGLNDPYYYGCDAAIEFPPHQLTAEVINSTLRNRAEGYSGNIYSYSDAVMNDIVAMPTDYPRYKCVMPGWDNTPRRGAAGNVFHGATPQLYELWLREAIGSSRRKFPIGQRMIFINAWNEWGEGAHIEPDIRFGRQYLEATRRAIIGLSDWRTIMAGAKSRLSCGRRSPVALSPAIIPSIPPVTCRINICRLRTKGWGGNPPSCISRTPSWHHWISS